MAFVNLLTVIYPVGAIYITTSSTSPSSLISGTWEKIENAVVRGTSSAVGYIGSDTHTLTIDEMPSHNHPLYFRRRNLSTTSGYAYTMQTSSTDPDDTSSAFFSPSTVGGGQSMSLVQRSYNCLVWRRTA